MLSVIARDGGIDEGRWLKRVDLDRLGRQLIV